MTALSDTVETDQALKAKHRAMWALGDYPSVAAEIIPDLGARLVAACGVGPRDRALDVASGSGNAAIPAAMAGAKVVASDLTPAMFEAGRRQAAYCGVDIDWREADAGRGRRHRLGPRHHTRDGANDEGLVAPQAMAAVRERRTTAKVGLALVVSLLGGDWPAMWLSSMRKAKK